MISFCLQLVKQQHTMESVNRTFKPPHASCELKVSLKQESQGREYYAMRCAFRAPEFLVWKDEWEKPTMQPSMRAMIIKKALAKHQQFLKEGKEAELLLKQWESDSVA